MTTPNDGGPAFPTTQGLDGYGNQTPITLPNGETGWVTHHQGMTLRDYFAAKAMAALIEIAEKKVGDNALCQNVPNAAYLYADAMIAERNKEQK